MIISKTPLRISFVGGGTDLASFYKKESGAVVSTAIDKYMYVSINKKFDHRIRLSYTKTEIVDKVGQLEHELIRETMRLTGVTSGVEITTVADIPAAGTGLGSSSSLTVGALNALYAYLGKYKSAETLAQEACRIEIDIVGEPIGKQDQYIAAYGGLKYIEFQPDGNVLVSPILCQPGIKARLERRLLLFYTGLVRKAGTILKEQTARTEENLEILRKMKHLAVEIRDSAGKKNFLDNFGEFLHQNWLLKKKLTSRISNALIDEYYERACQAGAEGGKVLGAGGGGFLLLYCKEDKQDRVRQTLKELPETPFRFEPHGSKIIYVEE